MDNRVLSLLMNPSVVTLVQTTVQVAMVARQLRQQQIFGKADAVHLSTAIATGADYFMTTDERLPIGQSLMGVQIALPQSPEGNLVLPV